MSPRIVMHVDMDAFYASVELRRRPELRGTAVIVGGSPRGVVLSATYEARARGVRSGMSSTEARRLAPRATFVVPDFDSYSAVSKAIVAVFRSVTSVVESASIDEAFLDLTGAVRMFGSPVQIGEYVRAVVADEQQITCSVGIGPTKFVAKVASRAAKPDGLIEVPPEGSRPFCTRYRLRRCGEWVTRPHRSCIDLASTPSATSPTRQEAACVRSSARTQAACSASWRGGGTVAASPHWSRSTASARRRLSGGTPTILIPCAASYSGWRTARLTGCGNSKWWAAQSPSRCGSPTSQN